MPSFCQVYILEKIFFLLEIPFFVSDFPQKLPVLLFFICRVNPLYLSTCCAFCTCEHIREMLSQQNFLMTGSAFLQIQCNSHFWLPEHAPVACPLSSLEVHPDILAKENPYVSIWQLSERMHIFFLNCFSVLSTKAYWKIPGSHSIKFNQMTWICDKARS